MPTVIERDCVFFAFSPDLQPIVHVRQGEEFVMENHGDFIKIPLNDAGMLMSLVGSLKFCQVVDPEKTVRFEFPKSVLKEYGYELPLSGMGILDLSILPLSQQNSIRAAVAFPGVDDMGIRDGGVVIRASVPKQGAVGVEVQHAGIWQASCGCDPVLHSGDIPARAPYIVNDQRAAVVKQLIFREL